MEWGTKLIQFVIGGLTVVVATALSEMKGRVGVMLGALLATMPVQDMLPVVFLKSKYKSEQYSLRNSVSNIAVVVGMFALFICIKRGIAKKWCVGIGVATWLVIAVVVQVIAARFETCPPGGEC